MPDPGSPWERENPNDGLGYIRRKPAVNREALIEAGALADVIREAYDGSPLEIAIAVAEWFEAELKRQGYVAVPREPNHDITAAVVKPSEDRTWAVEAYRAMIEAAESE